MKYSFVQEIVLWRKQDKIKQKNSSQQYAHFEPMHRGIRSENSVTGISAAGDNSPVNGPSSSGNNSDSPAD